MNCFPRRFLPVLLTALLLVSAVLISSRPVRAAAPTATAQAPGYFRIHLGQFEVTALYDGGRPFNTSALRGDKGEIQSLLQRDFFDLNAYESTVTGFLVNTGAQLILIDTGTGGHSGGPLLGKLAASLDASGVRPEQVDIVLLTHMHFDHAGGLTTLKGKRAFPRADVRVAKAEAAYYLGAEPPPKTPSTGPTAFQLAREGAAPYIAANKWHPFDPGEEIVPGLKAIAIPGHTPGHTGYETISNGRTMMFWGDVVHASSVQMAHPEIGVQFDADGPTAIKQRQELLAGLASKDTLVAGAHMPFLSIGRVRAEGTSFVWVPVPFTYAPWNESPKPSTHCARGGPGPNGVPGDCPTFVR